MIIELIFYLRKILYRLEMNFCRRSRPLPNVRHKDSHTRGSSLYAPTLAD